MNFKKIYHSILAVCFIFIISLVFTFTQVEAVLNLRAIVEWSTFYILPWMILFVLFRISQEMKNNK